MKPTRPHSPALPPNALLLGIDGTQPVRDVVGIELRPSHTIKNI